MKTDMKTLVIIPAYNEETTVGKVIEKVQRKCPFADILVVNDGSLDLTSAVARQKGAFVLDLSHNLGIGAAMQSGYKFAYKRGYDVAVQCDADGQHRPGEIKKIVDVLFNEDVDMVVGSRYLRKKRFRSMFFRRLGILVFSKILSFIIGQRLTDTTSGFRAVNREVIKSFARYYPDDYPEPEAIVLLHREGFRIKEVSVNMNGRKGGSSSITGFRPVYYMIKVLLAIFIDLCKEVPCRKEIL